MTTKAKKPPAKKHGREIPEAKLREIVKRLTSGESKLIEESHKIGAKDNNRLRTALRALLGRPAYEKMIASGMKQRVEQQKKPTKLATAAWSQRAKRLNTATGR